MDSSRLRHFEMLEKIREGGMGRVYKARDTRLERRVVHRYLSPTDIWSLPGPDWCSRARRRP